MFNVTNEKKEKKTKITRGITKYLPEFGAIEAGLDMIAAGTVVMAPVVVGGNMWAGKPIVCDWW